MRTADGTRIDLPVFLRVLRRERYPTAVIHAPPLAGKTTFARRLAQEPGISYLDLLERLATDEKLSARMDQFDVETLRHMLLDCAANVTADVMLVDELDYIIPIWGSDLRPL